MQESASTHLQALAQAAVIHASDQHGVTLNGHRMDLVDQVLNRERQRENVEDHSAVVLCYGSWLGEWAVANVGGSWVGMAEPTPPRMIVAGVPTSPMDAVARRLADEHAPDVETLVKQWVNWAQDAPHEKTRLVANRSAWDARKNDPKFVQTGPLPTSREDAMLALDPWLQEETPLEGKRILCLAAGGGKHGPLLAQTGAKVTVVDFSPEQLSIDQTLARQEGLRLETVETSMEDLAMFPDANFDIVVHPVSTCYVPDIVSIYEEVSRVLRPGGLYFSQHKQPGALQSKWGDAGAVYWIDAPADDGYVLSPTNSESHVRESEMTEYVHSWDALIGGLCRCGFAIEDLQEPPRADAWAPVGTSEHQARFAPPYVKIKARKSVR